MILQRAIPERALPLDVALCGAAMTERELQHLKALVQLEMEGKN